MKRKVIIIPIIIVLTLYFLLPLKLFAAGGFGVSSSSVTMYVGDSKTISITSNNAVGKLHILSSNSAVASVSPGSVFIQNPGSSQSITITANALGTATISVVASNDFATMDEEILEGQTRTITVNVIAKTENNNTNNNSNNNTNNNTNNGTNNVNNNNANKPSNNNINNSNSNNNDETNKNKSTNANLKEVAVDGYELEKLDDNNYKLTVAHNVTNINVKAIADDDKANITGTGSHDLNVGENNIELVVTSESGNQNKINIKVNRKDGYYLEDLDILINDSSNNESEIIIDANTVISKDDMNKIKQSKKCFRLNYYDENKKLIYSWTLDGSKIKDETDLNTKIDFVVDSNAVFEKASNYAKGKQINFKHEGKVPNGTIVKIYVGDSFKDGDLVNVYCYVDENVFEIAKESIEVSNGYIEFEIDHCSKYFVTQANLNLLSDTNNKLNKTNYFIIIALIELLVIAILITVDCLNVNPLNKLVNKIKK